MPLYKKVIYYIEYQLFRILLVLLRLMLIERAANMSAFLMRKIGPLFNEDKVARANIRLALPDLDAHKVDEIMAGVWDNFGRYIGEYAHIECLSQERFVQLVELEGVEQVKKLNKPFILCAGHFANWDLMAHISGFFEGQMGIIYRRLNNIYINEQVKNIRQTANCFMIEKGVQGKAELLKALKQKHNLAMLVDQKMNEGIAIDFLGRPAMTAPAIAKFALKFGYAIIPTQIIRTHGSKFKVILHPELRFKKYKDEHKTVLGIMQKINNILGDWVKARPEQWFWLHKRWRGD